MRMEKKKRRDDLYQLLGDLPPHSYKISSKKLGEVKHSNYVAEHLMLNLNGIEPVAAYFVRPIYKKGPHPVILFNHSHGGNYELGKQELMNGNRYLENPPYAEELTNMGYSVLCIDASGFGSRRRGTESELFKELLWSGQVLWGTMVYDHLRAIDYLVSRSDVDSNRMGTLGMSMGGTMSWWTAALDTRIKVCVDICSLADFQTLVDERRLDGHGLYYYVPGLLKYFTTSDINALIAPRSHLSLAGNYDPLTPVNGLDKIDKNLKEIYFEEDAPNEAWKLLRSNVGHFETADMRYEIKAFLKQWL